MELNILIESVLFPLFQAVVVDWLLDRTAKVTYFVLSSHIYQVLWLKVQVTDSERMDLYQRRADCCQDEKGLLLCQFVTGKLVHERDSSELEQNETYFSLFLVVDNAGRHQSDGTLDLFPFQMFLDRGGGTMILTYF